MVARRLVARRFAALSVALGVTGCLALSACSSYRDAGSSADADAQLASETSVTIARFKAADPSIARFFDNAYGFVVFPEIAKGAAGIGAATGDGTVHQGGQIIGYAGMTQVTIGLQLGGQAYSQVMFFQDATSFGKFTSGRFEFAANASAVAVKSGAAATNDYSGGIAVFVLPKGGLMAEASIGGQKFSYRAK